MTLSSMITILQKIIDISLVWILIYSVLKSLKDNVKMILIFKGVIIIVFVKLLSDYLNLTTVGLLLEYVIMWGPLALIIIFQPEIRNILEHLGRQQILTRHRVLTMDEREKMCRALILEIRKGSNKDVKLKKEETRAFEKGIVSECSKKEYKK